MSDRDRPDRPDRPAPRPKAVALSYDKAHDPAPRVVASGQGEIARQILELAFAHGVKVREDADLVEILAAIDVDTPIPLEAYVAVAEILNYVYRAESRKAGVPKGGPTTEPSATATPPAPPRTVRDRIEAVLDRPIEATAKTIANEPIQPKRIERQRPRTGRFTPGEDWSTTPPRKPGA